MQCLTFHIVLILAASNLVRALFPHEPDTRVGDSKGEVVKSNCGKKTVRAKIFNQNLCPTSEYHACNCALERLGVLNVYSGSKNFSVTEMSVLGNV